jgi:hypothetical protein
MMKIFDKIVLAVFLVGLVILCFLQECGLDIYFLILGFAVAAMAALSMYLQGKQENENENEYQ